MRRSSRFPASPPSRSPSPWPARFRRAAPPAPWRRVVRALLVGLLPLPLLAHGPLPFATARADELHLTNGAVLEGEVEKTEEGYVVKTRTGRMVIPAREVKDWIRKPTPDRVYALRKAALAADDFDGHMALGRWCRDQGMPDRARWHFMSAVALRPENGTARRAAGFQYSRGEWLTRAEWMHARGKEKYKGKWIPAEEAAAERLRDQRTERREAVYADAWAIIRRVGREPAKDSLAPGAKELVALGPAAMKAIWRGAGDLNDRSRALCAVAAAHYSCRESLEILITRLRRENNPALVALVARLFRHRGDRLQTLTGLLDSAMSTHSKRSRNRVWLALRGVADRRAIDVLIENADYNPVQVDTFDVAISDDKVVNEHDMREYSREEGGTATQKLSGSRDQPSTPYYPATEGLQALTGMAIPPDNGLWAAWWEEHRETFAFEPLEAAPAEAIFQETRPIDPARAPAAPIAPVAESKGAAASSRP